MMRSGRVEGDGADLLVCCLPVRAVADGVHSRGCITTVRSSRARPINAMVSRMRGSAGSATLADDDLFGHPERHSTTLYTSGDADRLAARGLVLDHQNRTC